MEHKEEGIWNLALRVEYMGLPLAGMLGPDKITEVDLNRQGVSFEIYTDDNLKLEDNFYFIFGNMKGLSQALLQAHGQIFDQVVKDRILNNHMVITELLNDIYDECLKSFPEGIIEQLKKQNVVLNS